MMMIYLCLFRVTMTLGAKHVEIGSIEPERGRDFSWKSSEETHFFEMACIQWNKGYLSDE